MLHARWQRDGLPWRERFFSNVDLLGRIGTAAPGLANAIIDLPAARALMDKTLGISAKRSLPHYARERFDRWFETRNRRLDRVSSDRNRGKLILWDDTFVRYHEPNIGIAAVKVLEALGFEVELRKNRQCCGRPAFSQGNLGAAAHSAQHNVDFLSATGESTAIVFLEPSCWSMFVEDYRELKIENTERIAERCVLFEKFVDDLFAREPDALQFKERVARIAIHAHCHAKSLTNLDFLPRLIERVPGHKSTLLETGCCGMAGAFGALTEKYELSKQVAADLLRKIDDNEPDVVVASGTSCRHQIVDLSERWPKHPAEVLADALA